MNREALVLYLENLKNLEIIKFHLNTVYSTVAREKLENEKYLNSKERVPHIPLLPIFGCFAVIAMSICAVLLWLHYDEVVYGGEGYNKFLLFSSCRSLPVTLGIGSIILIICSIKTLINWKIDCCYIKSHNAKIDNNTQDKLKSIANADAIMERCKKEYQKADLLLKDMYSLNLVPIPYRELKSIIYIADYMSTSQATLEDTLMHSHMQEGIDSIVSRLDIIVNQNYEIIRQLKSISNQNAGILYRLENIQADAATTAHFARCATYYRQMDIL